MRISLNKIKSYVKIPDGVSDQELIERIGSRLVEVEEVIDWSPMYQGVYIAKVISCEPIPETHLHLCRIDVGSAREDLRGDNGLIQVVCGAPNVHAGMLAVWIAPGSIVPETYGNENFKLSVRKLRGYESYGMLAGADELGFDNEHKSIAEIDPKMAEPGDSFAEVFDLNDLILDVENKSLTHRPDCFGLIGFAREVAGILGEKFIEPEVFQNLDAKIEPSRTAEVKVKITDGKLCPRYSCAVFDLPDNQPSKYLTLDAVSLAKAGMRSIDPMVDLTNILMLETGQPLHAFDYDKLVAVGGTDQPEIVVRSAKAGEELQLLDGKVVQCTADDILITSNNVPVAMAGAMGGKNTEIDPSTKRVVLESATFSLYNLRKTQMSHGIFSEAITRFTKGQPAVMTIPVLAEAVKRLGVEVAAVADDYPGKEKESVVKITTDEINGLLGTEYGVEDIVNTLENVGFEVEVLAGHRDASCETIRSATSEDRWLAPVTTGCENAGSRKELADVETSVATLKVTSPAWRTDIHIKEDIIEEVGRLLGYDNIELSLPEKPFIEPEIDPMVKLKQELRRILSERLEMHELLTYSFVSRDLVSKVGKNPDDCYEIVNSISPELQCFRSEIVPSLLDKVRENLKAGHRDFTLYELNQVTRKSGGLNREQVPEMKTHLGIVSLGDFYQLKAEILAMFRELKIAVEYRALSAESAEAHPYLEPKRSAELLIDEAVVGSFGEVKTSVLRKFKLEPTVSTLELNLEKVVGAPREVKTDVKISKFPSVERDLTLRVAGDMPFGRALNTIDNYLSKSDMYYAVEPVSIYQPEGSETKNLSFHIKFSDPTRTLNSDEISAIMKNIAVEVAGIGAEIV